MNWKALIIAGSFLVLLGATCTVSESSSTVSESSSESNLRNLHAVDELREQFNTDHGAPRVLLLLSPT
ncbi:hypothetical protein MYX84_14065 [Acidobacteria bacterium AH-259-O06]|nr:hypothetical protein [Acidobacteria bacterium AH-259-O06]